MVNETDVHGVDVGAFCQATGTDFNAHCWPYVATMFLQSKANNNNPTNSNANIQQIE